MWIIDHDGTNVSTAADFDKDPVAAAAANIAKAATSAGDFLWRFGDPAIYQQGTAPSINSQNWITLNAHHKQMGKTHDAQWIQKGLPGYGHVLIFNDGDYCFDAFPQSSVLEIDPYSLGTLNLHVPFVSYNQGTTYVNPPDAGYTTRRRTTVQGANLGTYLDSNQIVWAYRNAETSGMFCDNGGNTIRLWNGNTLISSKTEGHYVEVTPLGEVVWEYVNPTTPDGIKSIIGPGYLDRHSAGRIWRYPYNHPAFKGQDLSPKGTLTGKPAYSSDAVVGSEPLSDSSYENPQSGFGYGSGGTTSSGSGGY
jgi:hypothetical protein